MKNLWEENQADPSRQSEFFQILDEQIGYMSKGIKSRKLWATVVTVTDTGSETITHAVHIMPLKGSTTYTGRYLEITETPSIEGVFLQAFSNPPEPQVHCETPEKFMEELSKTFRHKRTSILLGQLESLTKD